MLTSLQKEYTDSTSVDMTANMGTAAYMAPELRFATTNFVQNGNCQMSVDRYYMDDIYR